MNIKENIQELLNNEEISNYKISKETGIAQTTLSDLKNGKSKIGNMKLDHAIKLNEYFIENNLDELKILLKRVQTFNTSQDKINKLISIADITKHLSNIAIDLNLYKEISSLLTDVNQNILDEEEKLRKKHHANNKNNKKTNNKIKGREICPSMRGALFYFLVFGHTNKMSPVSF